MSALEGRALGAAVFFFLTLLSGSWLSHLGRPLNLVLSTLHKLLGLGAGIYLVVTLVQFGRSGPPGAGVIVAAVVTGLALLAGAATGAFLSGRPPTAPLRRLHATASFVALLGAATLLWMLL